MLNSKYGINKNFRTSNASLQNQSNVSNPGGPPDSPSFVMNVPSHYAQITHDFTDIPTSSISFGARRPTVINGDGGTRTGQLALPDSVCPYPPVDVSKVTVQEVKFPDQPRGKLAYFSANVFTFKFIISILIPGDMI